MNARRIIVCLTSAALLATALGGVGDAAVKRPTVRPVCNLLKDDPGDAWLARQPNSVAYPSLDIVSADVASDGVTLSAAIRVKQLTQSDNNAPAGREWDISFSSGNDRIGFTAVKKYDGEFFNVTGIFDYAKNEIRFKIPVKGLKAKLTKGTILDRLDVTGSVLAGLPTAAGFGSGPAIGGPVDQGTSAPTTRYTIGTPSCLKVNW
jgi:hypothetical protein